MLQSHYKLVKRHCGHEAQSIPAFATVNAGKSADFNGDKIVNSLDFSIMSRHWLANYFQADLNSDGIINSLDFSILVLRWETSG